MRIDLPAGPTWRSISESYRAWLPFQDANVHVHAYAGLRHALYEVTHGLARVFSHKRTIAIAEGAEPALETLLTGFAEDGYTIKILKATDLADLDGWLQPLLNELLFVLFSNDDPVTGRIYDRTALNRVFADKRVFRIGVSHAVSHLATIGKVLERPQPFKVRVLSLSPARALVLAGERFRVNPVLADRLPWGETSEFPSLATSEEIGAAREAIRQFESTLPAGFKTYFAADDEARVFDRAVIYHPEIDGSALIDEVAARLSLELPPPGFETALETTSPCRWNQPRLTDWLLARGESETVVRGLVCLQPAILNEAFLEALAASAEKILKIQNG